MSILGTLSRSPMYLDRGERVDVTLTVTEDGGAYDLSDVTIILEIDDSEGETFAQKSSANDEQIEIDADPTTGIATIKFVGDDSIELDWPNTLSIWLYDGPDLIAQIFGPKRVPVRESALEPDQTPPGVVPVAPEIVEHLIAELVEVDTIDATDVTATTVVADTLEVAGERIYGGEIFPQQFGLLAGGGLTPEQRAQAIDTCILAARDRSAKPAVVIIPPEDNSALDHYLVDRLPGQNHVIRMRSGVDFIGRGWGSKLKVAGGVHAGDHYFLYPWLESDILIRDICLDGNRYNAQTNPSGYQGDEQSHIIQARGTSYMRIENVLFQNTFGDAIKAFGESALQPTKHLQIHHCNIRNTGRSGFAILADTYGWQVTKCIFEDINDQHIDYEASGPGGIDNLIAHCRFLGNDQGIRITMSGGTSNSDLTRVHDCMIRGGVEANGSMRVAFHDNDVFQNSPEVACLGLSSGLVRAKVHNNRFHHTDATSVAVAFGPRQDVQPEDCEFHHNWIYAAGGGMQVNSCNGMDVLHNRFFRTGARGSIGLQVTAIYPTVDNRVFGNRFYNWTTALSVGSGVGLDGLVVSENKAVDCYTAAEYEGSSFSNVSLGPWHLRNTTAFFGGLRNVEPWLEGGIARGVSSAGVVNDNSPIGALAGFTAPEGFLAARPGSTYRQLATEDPVYGAVALWLKQTGTGNTGWKRMLTEDDL